MSNLFVAACMFLLATQGGLVEPEKLSSQEAFFLRRITEFWKDKDYGLVKKQIEEFLAAHPDSTIHPNLHAILADILYQERDYQKALEVYEKIGDASLQQKSLIRKTQCLYLLGNYDRVISILSGTKNEDTELQFLMADSLFRTLRSKESLEEQKQLALQAKPLLLGLYETSYKDKVLLSLAEVHRILDENPQAASLYVLLAEQMPDKKEEILLQVASLQLSFNKNGAIETYQQIVNLGKSKASEAAYNEMLLLFQENRYADLVSRASILSPYLVDDKKTLFDFCLGRSHFKLEHYPEAVVYFEKYISEESENTPYKRATFLTLIHCAQKTQDGALFDRVLDQFLAAFSEDEEASKALLLHAQTALQNGNDEVATVDMGKLLSQFPSLPEKETLLYDYALLLTKTKKWADSRQAFLTYLNEFPQASHGADLIWPSIVHCSIQELKEAENDPLEKKAQLVSDLQEALKKSNLFAPEEQSNYQFLLGQLLFDLKSYEESLSQLASFSVQYPNHPSIPQALLLQAHLHRELQSAPQIFAEIGEKALSATTDQENKTALRLQLFNSYLTLKEFDKAAEHLYQSHMIDQVAVHQENQLWLAHFYTEKGSAEEKNRAISLFQKILKTDENYSLHFTPEETYLEAEVLKLSELLPRADKKRLISSLSNLQAQNPSHPWKLKQHALFELGKLHLETNEPDHALAVFDELIASAQNPTFISNAALLEKSRILLARCPSCDRNENNPVMVQVLSTFKDLQIQKQIPSEPLHLEAALEYADIRTQMASPETRRESALFFLNRIKDDFNAKTDTLALEYHEARLRYPEKDHLFQNYMKCIEAEIFRLESELAREQNHPDKAEQSRQVAAQLLEELLEDKQMTPYLKCRVELNLKALSN